jgi:hypothetical protein
MAVPRRLPRRRCSSTPSGSNSAEEVVPKKEVGARRSHRLRFIVRAPCPSTWIGPNDVVPPPLRRVWRGLAAFQHELHPHQPDWLAPDPQSGSRCHQHGVALSYLLGQAQSAHGSCRAAQRAADPAPSASWQRVIAGYRECRRLKSGACSMRFAPFSRGLVANALVACATRSEELWPKALKDRAMRPAKTAQVEPG